MRNCRNSRWKRHQMNRLQLPQFQVVNMTGIKAGVQRNLSPYISAYFLFYYNVI